MCETPPLPRPGKKSPSLDPWLAVPDMLPPTARLSSQANTHQCALLMSVYSPPRGVLDGPGRRGRLPHAAVYCRGGQGRSEVQGRGQGPRKGLKLKGELAVTFLIAPVCRCSQARTRLQQAMSSPAVCTQPLAKSERQDVPPRIVIKGKVIAHIGSPYYSVFITSKHAAGGGGPCKYATSRAHYLRAHIVVAMQPH